MGTGTRHADCIHGGVKQRVQALVTCTNLGLGLAHAGDVGEGADQPIESAGGVHHRGAGDHRVAPCPRHADQFDLVGGGGTGGTFVVLPLHHLQAHGREEALEGHPGDR